jgi:hypothetical protein
MSEKSSKVVRWMRNALPHDPTSGTVVLIIAVVLLFAGSYFDSPWLLLASTGTAFIGVLPFVFDSEQNDDR